MLTPPPNNFPPDQYRLIEWLVKRAEEQGASQSSIETNSKYVISQVDGALKRAEVITNELADTKVIAESTATAFPEIQAELGGVVDNIHRSGRVPAAVIDVAVTANTAHWLDIATPRSSVSLTWTPVTTGIVIDDDGPLDPNDPNSPPVEEIDDSIVVAGYEVWSRRPSQVLTRDAQVLENEATIDTWEPGVARIVRIRAVSKDGVPGLWSDEVHVTPAYPGTLIPKKVTGLAFTQTAEFTPVGPRATVIFTWDEVTQTTDDEPVEIAEYELWVDDSAVMRVTDAGAILVVPSQVSAKVQVAAITKAGARSDLSDPVTVVGVEPPVVARIPTAPSLTSSHGNVRAAWDGDYTSGGDVAGGHTVHVEARVGSGAWIMQGVALTSGGEQLVSVGAIGDTVEVRFTAYDQLQRLTGTSAVASITVQGVEFEDFDTASQNYILGIESKADEAVKSTVVQFAKNTSATTPPTSGWSTTRPSRDEGEHIWTRTLITYNNGTTSTTTPFSSTGDKGKDGTDGSPGAPGADGADGTDGADGSDGADGISVTSVVRYYRLGTTKPGQPSGASPSGWDTTEPEYMEWQNLYYADKVTYSNGTVSWSEVQLSSAYVAASQANAKADALEAGQVIIGRTVDGLNRRFTSIESPGRGYLGHENLVPRIEGSGEWVEIARNLNANPTFSQGVAGWSITSPANSLTYLPDGVRMDVSSSINAGTQVFQEAASSYHPVVVGDLAFSTFKVTVPADAPRAIPLRPRLTIRDSTGQTATDWYSGARVWIEPGQTVELSIERTVGGTRDSAQASVLGDSSQPLDAGDAFIVHDGWTVMVNPAVKGFIAPGIYFGDPYMRTRVLESGETVLEGEHPNYAFTSSQISPYLTHDAPDSTSVAVRVERQTTNAIAIPIGNLLPEQYQTFTMMLKARPHGRDMTVVPRIRDNRGVNVTLKADVWNDIRVTLPAGGGSNTQTGLLLNSNTGSAGDIIDTALHGLYAGTGPDDDAIPFHNGDVWEQLGWKPGEAEGDPDRLVIEHIHVWNGQDWVHYDIWAENVYAAGSVTARVLNADEIYGDEAHMEVLSSGLAAFDEITGLGQNLNIRANDSIQFIIGDPAVEGEDGLLGEHSDRISAAEVALNGDPDDPESSGVVSTANEALIAAQSAGADLVELTREDGVIDSLNKEVEELTTAVIIDSAGVTVTTKNSQYHTQITPLGVRIGQSGTDHMTFEGTALTAPQVNATSFPTFAGHQVNRVAVGRTTITPL